MLADAGHRALADYSKALNAFCLAHPALYAPQSFAWTAQDASTGVLGFTLQAGCETLFVRPEHRHTGRTGGLG